ncbi:AlpA family transcriptional regulator [Parafrankia sp. BMG5.11]|uniref:helix-turn-helix transcriptional regulator n=1 Tax=Parafrankia sp. BMG5.11 TaxID=222540 RepID=UPI0010407CA7|nr:helix-turn-helix domain-containing protein [Parafrankia sp. BMG5.11]TCJ36852.1 DNA-binding protein [Parafrankia sp. BMG5.11]
MTPPDPVALWTTADIARRLGLTQERARQLANSESFPPPSFMHGRSRFWTIGDVEAWIKEHRPGQSDQ